MVAPIPSSGEVELSSTAMQELFCGAPMFSRPRCSQNHSRIFVRIQDLCQLEEKRVEGSTPANVVQLVHHHTPVVALHGELQPGDLGIQAAGRMEAEHREPYKYEQVLLQVIGRRAMEHLLASITRLDQI